MPKLHIINSHLGGMGKSLFSRVMLHLHQVMEIPVVAFDADFQSYNLHRYYPQITHQIKFSRTDYTNTDGIIAALEAGSSVVVNLSSNAGEMIAHWVERDAIADVLEELSEQDPLCHYELVNWFLSNGTSSSLEEFWRAINTYGQGMTQVLVRNLGRSQFGAWEKSDENLALILALQQAKVSQVVFPRFYQPSGFDDWHCSFADLLEDEKLNLLDLQRVETFLEECQNSILELGLLFADSIQTSNISASERS